MTAYRLNELETSAFDRVMESYREEFQNKVQENNPDLLNFEKHGILALKALGVVGIDAIVRSCDEFTLNPVVGTPESILAALEKPETAWEKGTQEVVHKTLLSFIQSELDPYKAIQSYIEWHENEYATMLNDTDIGGHNALCDYILNKELWFDEEGEEVPAPALVC